MAAVTYRLLLLLLPGWFREEFAREMTAVFVDSVADARRDGPLAIAALWLRTTGDLLRLSARLHFDAARQDFSYAVRTLARTPAFTIAVVATLALGLGPTVVVANFFEQVVLSPLPFPSADRLVRVWNGRPEKHQSRIPLSLPDYLDYRERQTVFSALRRSHRHQRGDGDWRRPATGARRADEPRPARRARRAPDPRESADRERRRARRFARHAARRRALASRVRQPAHRCRRGRAGGRRAHDHRRRAARDVQLSAGHQQLLDSADARSRERRTRDALSDRDRPSRA